MWERDVWAGLLQDTRLRGVLLVFLHPAQGSGGSCVDVGGGVPTSTATAFAVAFVAVMGIAEVNAPATI